MKNHRFLFIIASLALSGCASTPIPGGSTADATLQRDVLRIIMLVDNAADKNCSQRKISDTEVLEKRPDGGAAAERWMVDRCGAQVNYRVSYQPSPQGGTMFGVKREQ